MKKSILLLTLFFTALTLLSHTAFSQVPQGIPYQAIARDNQGTPLADQFISLRFSVHTTAPSGAIVYQETHNVFTNIFGLFSINLGQGAPLIGTFNAIDWKDPAKFLQVELDTTGGTTYADMGTTQLMHVPYAMHAQSSASDKWSQTGSSISNINTGNVGIGTTAPTEKLDVNGKTKTTQLQITSNAGNNKVLVSDASGNANWSNANTVASGTLDQAYDFGGPGLGRTILADDGALKVAGDGLLVTGTFGSGDIVEISGAGTRMFFNPRKAAFRSGLVSSNYWDNGVIGNYSTAMGYNPAASGHYSTSLGHVTIAAGNGSTALGYYAYAAGDNSTSMGSYTTANGFSSTAIGRVTTANGDGSTAMGNYTIANGYSALAIGIYNDTLVSSQSNYSATTPLFIIGNGSGSTTRSNAMVVQYDGKVGIGTNTPKSKLDVEGGLTIGADYAGSTAAPSNGAIIQGNVGIGSITPQSKLSVDGGIAIGTSLANYFPAPTNGAIIEGKVGIGTLYPQSKLDVEGGLTIGATYAGTNAAPANGAIIQGKVGIGTTSPSSSLHIEGGTDVSLTGVGYIILGDESGTNIAMDNNEIMCRSNGAESDIYIQQDGGRVAIGSTGVPTHILHIDGQGRSASAFWATTSDQRVKKNVNSLPNTSLQKIMQLRPVTYQWMDNYAKAFKGLKQNNTGFISQELEQVFPEMIEKVEEKFGDETISDFKLLNLSDLPIHIVKAMQEQQMQIEAQKQQLEKLQNELIELKKLMMK